MHDYTGDFEVFSRFEGGLPQFAGRAMSRFRTVVVPKELSGLIQLVRGSQLCRDKTLFVFGREPYKRAELAQGFWTKESDESVPTFTLERELILTVRVGFRHDR